MTTINEVKLTYQQQPDINRGILTVSFNSTTHITFDINLDNLNQSTILDYDGLNIPPSMESYYTSMAYQIMTSHVFEYFHYND